MYFLLFLSIRAHTAASSLKTYVFHIFIKKYPHEDCQISLSLVPQIIPWTTPPTHIHMTSLMISCIHMICSYGINMFISNSLSKLIFAQLSFCLAWIIGDCTNHVYKGMQLQLCWFSF